MRGNARTAGTLTAIGIAAVVGIVATSAPALASAMPSPLPAKVTAQGDTVGSVIGSYCVNGEGVGVCVDSLPAEPGRSHRLTVAPRTGLRIEFRDQRKLDDDVVAASGTLVRFREHRYPRSVGRVDIVRTGDLWKAKLPKNLHRANALQIFTSLAGGGDISHFVGLKSSKRQPLRCPGKVGKPVQARELRQLEVDAATAVARERGCELRVVRIDGKDQAITDDLSYSRVNVIVRDGLVVGVDGIY